MKIKIFTSIGVMGALGLLAALPAHALGLGKIELSSALNEPFKAEIPVTAVSGDEAETLQVRLASNDEFERAGLVKSSAIIQLMFKVSQKAGKTVIMVSSKSPVKEPLLDFLLMAKTSNGQLIREYTVLLDPPKHVFNDTKRAPTVVSSPNISQRSQAQSQPQPDNSYQYNAPSLASANSYGPTSKTDTLWDIALKTRPNRDVSVQQMMVGLVNKNKKAFIRENANGLKSGYTLAIPSESEIRQLTRQQAKAAFSQQTAEWKNRNKAQATPPSASNIDTADIEEQVTIDGAEAQEGAALPMEAGTDSAQAPESRLQLLGSNEDNILSDNDLAAFGNEKVKELSEQLTVAQEVIEAQQQQNVDIKSRMAAMEEQIQTLRKLISLQDPDLARLQSKLEQDAASAPTLGDIAEDIKLRLTTELGDAVDSDALLDAESGNALAVVDETETGLEKAAETDGDESTSLDESSLAEEQGMPNQSEQDPTIVGEKEINSLNEAVKQDSIETIMPLTPMGKIEAFLSEHKLKVLAGSLGLLLALFFLGRKRKEDERNVSWDDAVKNVTSPQADTSPITAAAAVEVVTDDVVTEPELEDDDGELQPVAEKTVNEFIEEADRYIEKGDFDKAELALEQAHEKAPSNLNVVHKLLLTHYKQGKVGPFIGLAREYSVDRDSVEWAEVNGWGRALDAENKLFSAPRGQEPVIEDAVVDVIELDVGLALKEEPITIAETVEASAPSADNDLLDFNLDMDLDATAELDSLAKPLELKETVLDSENSETISAGELDAALLSDDEHELEFDLSDFDQIDEAETKLDLATAYIEMGDPEGAKNILEEIVTEGNDQQQSRAKKLLNDLS